MWIGRLVTGAVLATLVAPAPALAQKTVRGDVDRHLDRNLDRGDRKKKKQRRSRHHDAPPPPGGGPAPAPPPAPAKPEAPDPYAGLPRRVFGRHLKLDPKAGLGYRGWYAQQYPNASVDLAGYPMWSVGARARLFSFLTLDRVAFESNGLSGPGRREASIAVEVGQRVPQAAWLLGQVGVPLDLVMVPIARYESRAFETTARPNRPVRIVPHDTSPDADLSALPATTEPLRVTSAFQTFIVGMKYVGSDRDPAGVIGAKGGKVPPFYVGLGYTAYSKPYVLNVGGITLEDYIFDGRFQGLGLATGLSTAQRVGRPYLDAAMQLGLGEIRLLRNYTINEELPGDWLLGYLQGEVTLGYLYPLTRSTPTVLLGAAITGGGATFFAFETRAEEGETVDAPPLNWDVLWGAHVHVTVPL